ncbi:translation initiation factor IF-2-like [Vulpes lagopus]|uniref:translation initiation factor IF-2-like n=1 Tax=Vulpes lagopus TaxID=494514 RepID=UPI001BC9FE8E|nr:translation initiation factor IF-2-like [Vulpes lagopus]
MTPAQRGLRAALRTWGCRPAPRPRGGAARRLRRGPAWLPGRGRRARTAGADGGRLGTWRRAAGSPAGRGEAAGGQVCAVTGAAGAQACPDRGRRGWARARVSPPCREDLAGEVRGAGKRPRRARGWLAEFREPQPGRARPCARPPAPPPGGAGTLRPLLSPPLPPGGKPASPGPLGFY